MTASPKRDDESQDAYVIRLIREEERERCAAIADMVQKSMHEECDFGAGIVAMAIRSQSH